jgi:SH3-like domain-containing protein
MSTVRRAVQCAASGVVWIALTAGLAGCGHFKAKPSESYVFVTSKQGYIRDRVAAVSNRVAEVKNGERLKVLDHGRHFLKVQNDKGQIGWIEERAVATPETVAAFDQLNKQHQGDPEVAGGVTRDEVYMHLAPGRETEHFYLLEEGDKLKLLRRATIQKAVTQATVAKAHKAIPEAAGTHAARKIEAAPEVKKTADEAAPAPPVMEDWWLVRDAQGHTGWVFGRMIDVDAPDSLTRYSEGQKFVGAYVLTTVHDEGAPTDQKDVPVYVAVMNSYKTGLPYDFDQVRVFTWSLQHHRYETAFREKNIEGYLPVTVTKMKDPYGRSPLAQDMLPAFSYRVLTADAPPVVPNPETGAVVPTKTVTKTYRLEGNLVRSVGPAGASPVAEAHPEAEVEKKDKKKRK